jgi:hypothetical protein
LTQPLSLIAQWLTYRADISYVVPLLIQKYTFFADLAIEQERVFLLVPIGGCLCSFVDLMRIDNAIEVRIIYSAISLQVKTTVDVGDPGYWGLESRRLLGRYSGEFEESFRFLKSRTSQRITLDADRSERPNV